jgi:radical SAM superfamily enzyme YgiQ (UPF0313 family)
MSLKILLVGINARYTHSNLAIRYLRNALPPKNYEVDIAEFSINQNPLDILQDIYSRKPDVICLSVYIWNSDLIKKMLPDLKNIFPKSRLILGGPEVSYNPQIWIDNYPQIDQIIKGHGEAGLSFLAESNFTWQDKIIYKSNPKFSELPFPYLESDFPELEHKYIYYESSRGCSFRCSYCLSSRSDQKLEFRSIEQVKEELGWLLKREPKIIKFVDRTFNVKPDFARNIWKFLIEQSTNTKFHFEIHPELLSKVDFEILQNCPEDRFQFEIGIQSTNPSTLKAIHRSQNWQKTQENIQKLVALSNIHLHVDLIAGLPYEDWDSLIRSFNDIISLMTDHFQVGFLKVLPGTEMQEKVGEYGIVSQQNPPYQILQNKWLSFEDLSEFEQIEKLVNSIINSENFKITFAQMKKKFTNSYALFQSLLVFCANKSIDLNKRDWQSVAKLLWHFVNEHHISDLEFFLDCLRWDWCQIAAGHHYPDFLNSKKTKEWKAIGLKSIRDERDRIDETIKLQSSQINRSIFFMPKTGKFRDRMNLDESIYAFVPIGKKKVRIQL